LLWKSDNESWFQNQRLLAIVRLLRAHDEPDPARGIGDQPSLYTWARRTIEELRASCTLRSRRGNRWTVQHARSKNQNTEGRESTRIRALSVHALDFTAAISLAASERPVRS
jgi:hypothetical protein